METWGVVFLGIIAFAALVQASFLIGLAVTGRRLVQRLDALQARLDQELVPALQNLERVSRNVAEVSDLVTLQARRIDLMLVDTIEKVEDTTALLQRLVLRPLRPLSYGFALFRAVRRGIDVYRRLSGHAGGDGAGRPRHHEDDEHLFI
jgi:hypothetical protein